MSADLRWAAGASGCALLLMVFTLAGGCASGETAIGQQESDGGSSGTSMSSSMGGDGTGAMGGDGTGAMSAGGTGAQGGQGGVDPCAGGCPADTYDIDDNPLTGTCGCEYACVATGNDDPIDANYTDDDCDGSDGDMEDCIFVSASDGSASGAGTRLDPLNTIAAGIAAADTNNVSSVCVSGEVYNGSVTMISGINVYGGFDHQDVDFKFKRKSDVTTTVQAFGTVFLAENINDETHIAGLKIEAFTPATPGESTYGVRLTGGSAELFVELNDIHAFPGANGANGGNGNEHAQSQAADGTDGGDACEQDDNPCMGNDGVGGVAPGCTLQGGDGGNGIMGGDGQNGQAGGIFAGGLGGDGIFAEPSNLCALLGEAEDGIAGVANTSHGPDGTTGQGGDDIGVVAAGLYVAADGDDGAPGVNGVGGPGGGGGGGEGADILCTALGDLSWDRGAGGGSGGCGGEGGAFGGGGGGGGGSFAVFASGGVIRVFDNAFTVDGGGDGGDGGTGQLGQTGGAGGDGGAIWLDGGDPDNGAGGDGGAGSNGGDGAPGAGGGGGPSATLAITGGVLYTFQNNSVTLLNGGGNKGDGGVNNLASPSIIAPDGEDGKSGNPLQI